MRLLVIPVLLAAFAFASFSLILGIRLLRLHRRTHELPELLLGIGYPSGGFLASALGVIRNITNPPEGPTLVWLEFATRVAAAVACVLVLTLAWRVFRPDASWAKALVALDVLLFITYVFRDQVLGRHDILVLIQNPLYWCNTVALALPYWWVTIEAIWYQVRIRRRHRIGLPANLAVATQMLLWAIGMGAIGVLFISLDLIRLFLHASRTAIMLTSSSLGVVNTVCLYLAFFMPRSLVERLEARSKA
jgi:hypothetical protein